MMWIWVIFTSCASSDDTNERIIKKGDFSATLTETGELLAVNARSVLMPFVGWEYGWQYRITGLAEHGIQVHKGDSVAQVDPANVQKFLLEQENLLEVEEANLTKLLVEQSNKSRELEANQKEFQASYDLKKLELEKFKFESERKQKIKELEFQQATIHLEMINRTIELERIIAENSLKIQRIKVAQIKNKIEDAREAVEKLTIFSPIDGIFQVAKSRRTKNLYQVGDNTYIGAELALVPDLTRIKVISSVHETDIGKVKTGQKVIVRLEAYPDKPFMGKISELGKLSYKKEEDSKVKVFDSEVLIEESDPVLKPGMTVSCEIYYAELKDVLYVDNSCLKRVDDTYYLYIKEKNNWIEQPVTIGPRNNKYTVVYGDLKQGTELMLQRKESMASVQ